MGGNADLVRNSPRRPVTGRLPVFTKSFGSLFTLGSPLSLLLLVTGPSNGETGPWSRPLNPRPSSLEARQRLSPGAAFPLARASSPPDLT